MNLPALIDGRLAQLGITQADLGRMLAPVWGYENPHDVEGRLSRWRRFHAGSRHAAI
jgi:hypothetical protein